MATTGENDAGRMPTTTTTTTSSSCFPRLRLRLRLVNPPRRRRRGPRRGSTAVAVAWCAVWIPPVATAAATNVCVGRPPRMSSRGERGMARASRPTGGRTSSSIRRRPPPSHPRCIGARGDEFVEGDDRGIRRRRAGSIVGLSRRSSSDVVVLAREDGPADAAPADDDVTAEGGDGDTMVTTMTTMTAPFSLLGIGGGRRNWSGGPSSSRGVSFQSSPLSSSSSSSSCRGDFDSSRRPTSSGVIDGHACLTITNSSLSNVRVVNGRDRRAEIAEWYDPEEFATMEKDAAEMIGGLTSSLSLYAPIVNGRDCHAAVRSSSSLSYVPGVDGLESFQEPQLESFQEPQLESFQETQRESIQETQREPIGETQCESIGEAQLESFREPHQTASSTTANPTTAAPKTATLTTATLHLTITIIATATTTTIAVVVAVNDEKTTIHQIVTTNWIFLLVLLRHLSCLKQQHHSPRQLATGGTDGLRHRRGEEEDGRTGHTIVLPHNRHPCLCTLPASRGAKAGRVMIDIFL